MSLLALRARAAAASFACSGGGICRAAPKPSIQAVLPGPTALGASMGATRMWPGKATAGASLVAGSGPKASSGATAACSAEAVASSPGSGTKPYSGASWIAGSGPKASSGATGGKPAAPSPASAGHLNANKGGFSWQAGPKPSSGATSGKPAAPAGPLNTNKGAVKTDAATPAITGGPVGVSWVAGRTKNSTPTGLSILFDKGAAGSHGCSSVAGSLRKHLPTVSPSSASSAATGGIAIAGVPIGVSWVAGKPSKATPTGLSVLLAKADPKTGSTSTTWICPWKMPGATPTPVGPFMAKQGGVMGTLPKRLMSTSSKVSFGSKNLLARCISSSSGSPPPRKLQFLRGVVMGILGGILFIYYAAEEHSPDLDVADVVGIPKNWDWAALGYTPPVFFVEDGIYKFGFNCGSCFAKVAVQVAESASMIAYGRYTPLSIQQVIDCASKPLIPGQLPYGCFGGHSAIAFHYMAQVGLTTARKYPFSGLQGFCKLTDKKPIVLRLWSYQFIENNEEDMMMAVLVSPISVGVYSNPYFRSFSGGSVIEMEDCPPSPDGKGSNHEVLLVGYGEDSEGKYWIIQNIWGPWWGDNGFAKVRRGGSDPRGVLGIMEHRGVRPILERPQ